MVGHLNRSRLRLWTIARQGAYHAAMGRMAVIIAGAALSVLAAPALARESDAQIRQRIIAESRASYPGSCPCPDNTDGAGRRCGARSAYSRPGGYAPKCYASDVSAAEVAAYRASH